MSSHDVHGWADEENGSGADKRSKPAMDCADASVLVPGLILASLLLSGCSGGMTVQCPHRSVISTSLVMLRMVTARG